MVRKWSTVPISLSYTTPHPTLQSLRTGLGPHMSALNTTFATLSPDWQTRLRPSLTALESCHPLLDQMDRARCVLRTHTVL